jgi:DME family drug/metabolite transporter
VRTTTVLRVRSRLLVVFAAACFSTTGTAQALGPDDASPIAVAVMRTLIGALALTMIAKATPRPPVDAPVRRMYWWLAGAGMAGYAVAFFTAVRLTGVAVGTVVALGSAPLFTGAISAIGWRHAPTRRWLVTTTIAVVGVTLIVTQGNTSDIRPSGVALAATAGLSYAIFALSSKVIVNAQPSGARAMARVFVIAALFIVPAVPFVDLSWLRLASGLTMAVWLGVVTVAIAYWAYATGLRNLKPTDTTALTLVEPVMATILAATILDERPTSIAWIGIVIVIVSLAFGANRNFDSTANSVQH